MLIMLLRMRKVLVVLILLPLVQFTLRRSVGMLLKGILLFMVNASDVKQLSFMGGIWCRSVRVSVIIRYPLLAVRWSMVR